jgi:hypothetical protein
MNETLIVEESGIPLLRAQGYIPLTDEYILPEEEEIMERAIALQEKNSRTYMLVRNDIGMAIWIKSRFVLIDSQRGEDV